jgi:hypothetical protein
MKNREHSTMNNNVWNSVVLLILLYKYGVNVTAPMIILYGNRNSRYYGIKDTSCGPKQTFYISVTVSRENTKNLPLEYQNFWPFTDFQTPLPSPPLVVSWLQFTDMLNKYNLLIL